MLLIWLNTRSGPAHVYEPFKKVLRRLRIDTEKYAWKEIRHTTAVDFYIGSDIGYQREQIEKLILNSGKRQRSERC